MKEILGVHFKTPNAACRSELARQPCRTKIITACISLKYKTDKLNKAKIIKKTKTKQKSLKKIN
jgi:hypothetical protein